jgi:transcriptional regulator with XRE-family HTH domain
MSSDPDLLRQVTEALWRGRSQQQIARALGVSDRTLRRWLIGSAPVPEGVWTELAECMAEHLGRLNKAAGDLAHIRLSGYNSRPDQ